MKRWLLGAILGVLSTVTFAAQSSPEGAKALIEQTSTEILASLDANKAKYQNNPAAFQQFIEQEISPHLAFNRMAEIALGRHLQEVRAAGKFDAFSQTFRKLLIRVYSKGWSGYTQAKIKVLGMPVVDKYNRAKVRVQVTDNTGKVSNMEFALWYDNGQWKIYDATFENVSLITGYRNTFDTELQRGGIDALINKMQSMN
ncbi:MlaC/ttg2D family ABC transporter substrate-binding protein [Suttonella ornithocola]|uniref:ABC transporter periplasmic binding protein MlaC n=1 Tax=Suttonella ornithocola TaxID=279832 RepID=A0A380MX29_9GAMM|nr:ABC transporter substrate-binding protein [Suttonella ornithocola]SUO96596.1 ABC transporter periplasmic binding protein MlaC [Suttonella ornithocola]